MKYTQTPELPDEQPIDEIDAGCIVCVSNQPSDDLYLVLAESEELGNQITTVNLGEDTIERWPRRTPVTKYDYELKIL